MAPPRRRSIVRTDHFYPGPPDLAVEIISWSNPAPAIAEKTARWLAAGVHVVVVVDSEEQTVIVHRPSGATTVEDVLAVEEVVPGWQFPLSAIFE